MAEVAADTAALVGQRARRPHRIPRPVVSAMALGYPLLRELKETRHQFERPFVLDSTLTQQTFGIAPSAWETTLRETVDYLSATAA
jgi:hypothetical protein